jgi:hypothetical protein
MPDVTPQDAMKFWSFIDKEHPEIGKQLPSRIIVNGAIVSFQPVYMTDDDYKTYQKLLDDWYVNNGFM